MSGYLDTRQMIIDTLMGRPEGTQIQPEDHQAYALNMLNYIRSIELSSGSTLTGIAETDTVPIEPLDSRVAYIGSVSQNSVETFTYFKNENNQPITITTTDYSTFVIFMWNTQYWEYQILPISVLENNSFVGYFVCNSNANSDKQITCNINELTTNMRILVLMENINTKNNVTLQINNTTAKPLYYNSQQASSANTWDAGEVLDIYYDGTNYQSISIKDKTLYSLVESVNVGSQSSSTNAFNSVPINLRKLGLKVTWYDTINTEWVTKQYIGSDLSGWNTESNWNSFDRFASGQKIKDMVIDDTGLKNSSDNALPKATDVMQLAAKLEGVVLEENKVALIESGSGQNVFAGYIIGKTGAVGTNTSNKYFEINVEGWDRVRFLGRKHISHNDDTLGFAFGNIVNGSFVSVTNYQYVSGSAESDYKEYLIDIPKGATVFRTNCKSGLIDIGKFYCYLQRGVAATAKGIVLTQDMLVNTYLNMNCIVLSTGNWSSSTTIKHGLIPINPMLVKSIMVMTVAQAGHITFLSDADNYPVAGAVCPSFISRVDVDATQCVEIAVPSNARFILFSKGSGSSTPYSIVLNSYNVNPLDEEDSIKFELECANMSSSTGMVASSTNANDILKRYGSHLSMSYDSLSMKILSVDGVSSGGTLTYYCYSHDFVFLGSTTDKDKIPFGTGYIRFGVAFSEIPAFKKIILSINYRHTKSFSVGITPFFSRKNSTSGYTCFSMEVDVPHIDATDEATTDYYRDNPIFSDSTNGRDFTQATFFFAKNYDALGKPTKTIVNFHGTTTYPFSRTSLSEGQKAIYGFLAKNGYNLIDVCTCTYNTNKLFETGGVYENQTYRDADYPTPLSWSCYQALIKRIKREFNIEQDGFYFLGKSAGGMNSITMAQRFGIKVKAIALIAPGIDVYTNMITVGSTSSNYFLSRIGCDNPQLSSGGRARKGAKPEDEQYLQDNSELINDFNPFFIGTDGFDKEAYIDLILSERTEAPINYPYSLINSDMLTILANAKRFFKTPIKIWHAIDDNAVPIEISEWFQKMCHNANCLCELRKWPAEHGRHYCDSFRAVDGESNIPVLTDYITPSGEIVQASVVYCEVVDWFNRW